MNDSTFHRRCEILGERGLDQWLSDELIDSGNRKLLVHLEQLSNGQLRRMLIFPFPAFSRGRYAI